MVRNGDELYALPERLTEFVEAKRLSSPMPVQNPAREWQVILLNHSVNLGKTPTAWRRACADGGVLRWLVPD